MNERESFRATDENIRERELACFSTLWMKNGRASFSTMAILIASEGNGRGRRKNGLKASVFYIYYTSLLD